MRLTREIQTVVNHQNSRSFPFFYLRAKHKRLTDLVARDKRRTFSKKYNRIKVLVCCFHGQPNTTRKPPNVQFPIAGLEGWGNLPSAIILFILFYSIFYFKILRNVLPDRIDLRWSLYDYVAPFFLFLDLADNNQTRNCYVNRGGGGGGGVD